MSFENIDFGNLDLGGDWNDGDRPELQEARGYLRNAAIRQMAKDALSRVIIDDSFGDVIAKSAELEFCISRQLAPFVLSSDPLDFYLSGVRRMVREGDIDPGQERDNMQVGLQMCQAIAAVLDSAGELIPNNNNEDDADLRDPAEIVAGMVYDPFFSSSFITIVLAGSLNEDIDNGDLNALLVFTSFVSQAGGLDLMRLLYDLIPALKRLNFANIQLFEEVLARLA
jgi:hypothetical protein